MSETFKNSQLFLDINIYKNISNATPRTKNMQIWQ